MRKFNIFFKIKAQVSLYLISIMVTLIVLTFVVINIGKTAKDKTYADNAADAGALAAATVMATAFNYNADANDNDEDGNLQFDDQQYDQNEEQRHQQETKDTRDHETQTATTKSSEFPPTELAASGQQGHEIGAKQADTARQQQELDKIHQNQQQGTENMRKATQSDQQGDCDYYTQALVAGYKYNFYNAGVSHRLGRINQRRYQQFLEGINCQTVQNGKPETFVWVDGAARIHTVTAIIEIEPANNYQMDTTQGDYSQRKATLDDKTNNLAQAQGTNASESGHYAKAHDIYEYPPENAAGNGASASERVDVESAQGNDNQEHADNTGNKDEVHPDAHSDDDKVINHVDDIIHSQTVYSSNFQFHMGSIVKGMRGDVDLLGPTFYPPVQSSAMASFNCKQSGEIYREGGGSSSTFEACLISAF